MTNDEIDIRLKGLSNAIGKLSEHRYKQNPAFDTALSRDAVKNPVAVELELLNMSAMAIFAMIGEIAKRLPERPV